MKTHIDIKYLIFWYKLIKIFFNKHNQSIKCPNRKISYIVLFDMTQKMFNTSIYYNLCLKQVNVIIIIIKQETWLAKSK